jgi:hypothetical protein
METISANGKLSHTSHVFEESAIAGLESSHATGTTNKNCLHTEIISEEPPEFKA